MATLQEAITIARASLQDKTAPYRHDDASLLIFANNAIDAICALNESLFYVTGELACATGTTLQTLTTSNSVKLVDVLSVKNGAAVREVDKSVMDRFSPGWHSATPAAATEWMRAEGNDSNQIYIYPPAPSSQVLIVKYVKTPDEYLIGATHSLNNNYTPIIAAYIVAQVHLSDTREASIARASAEMTAFVAAVGMAGKS